MKILSLPSKILNIFAEYGSIVRRKSGNFNNLPRAKNSFFQYQKEYANEKLLTDLTITECYNKYGIGCEYYITSFDTAANPVWGEDSSRFYIRKFNMMGMFELPSHTRNWTQFGIEISDIYVIQVSKRHFSAASKYDPSIENKSYNEDIYGNFTPWGNKNNLLEEFNQPLIGDIIRNKYDGLYYEVIQVEDNNDEFLQRSHEWDITVKIFRDNHISKKNVTENNGSDLNSVMDQQTDLFNLKNRVNTDKLNSIFINPDNTKPHNDPVVYINNLEKPKNTRLTGDW